jgi:hypothetical protein
MAARSPWENTKEEVCEKLRAGVDRATIRADYPDIPDATIRSWARRLRLATFECNTDATDSKPTPHVNVEVLPPYSSNLVPLDGAANSSDFSLARVTLRTIARDKNEPGSVRVQASLGLLKMVAMRAELPKHILEEIEEESNLNAERDRLTQSSPVELTRHYREALG